MINEEPFYRPRLRVLALTPGLKPGGAEAWLSGLVRHAYTVQYVRVIAATDKDWHGSVVDIPGVPVTAIKGGVPEAIEAVSQVKENYDLILHWGFPAMPLGFTGRPSVQVVHFSAREFTNYGDNLYRLTMGTTAANYLACVSQSGAEGFDPEKSKKTTVKVIHNGVDCERTRPIYGRAWQRGSWEIADDQKVLLYVGRFFRGKGPEKLVQALRHLPEEYVAVLYGWGDMAPDLRRMAENFPGRVIFPQPRLKGLGDVYAASDAVVIPSDSEAFPLVLIEAWQAGRPVVCSGFATLDELQAKHKTSLAMRIARPPTPEQVAEGVEALFAKPKDQVADLVATCMQLGLSEYTASAASGRWERYFHECMEEWHTQGFYGAAEVMR